MIHTAFIHGLSGARPLERLQIILGDRPGGIVGRFMATALNADRGAIDALGTTLAGSNRPRVVAGGTMFLTPGRVGTEDDAADAESPGGPRTVAEELALSMASRGVRASVIRLAPSVHGDGATGLIPQMIAAARKKQVAPYVDDGQNRWPAVHRLDAARLFRLALEEGAAGPATTASPRRARRCVT